MAEEVRKQLALVKRCARECSEIHNSYDRALLTLVGLLVDEIEGLWLADAQARENVRAVHERVDGLRRGLADL